jgi:hypothetical protein
MGLGRLNPGCKNTCDGCPGCFGSIASTACHVEWSTSGNPVLVEIRRDSVLVSRSGSGFINKPATGTYELFVQCTEDDELSLIDSVIVVANPSNCEDCCRDLGLIPDPSSVVPASVTFTGHPVWQAFNGTYYLHKRECVLLGDPCHFEYHYCVNLGGNPLLTPKVSYPLGQPGSYETVNQQTGQCEQNLSANLFQSGYFAGQWTNSSNVTFDVWMLPFTLSPFLQIGITPPNFPMRMLLTASVIYYYIRTSQLFGDTCGSSSQADVSLNDYLVSGNGSNLMPCGSSSISGVGLPDNVSVNFDRFPHTFPTNLTVDLFP